MEDVEIIRLYWARDESAIPAAAEKYGNYCASIAQNLLGNREDAEECVNDTWLRAWNAIPPQRPGILPAFLERDWDGSTFHFACGEVWIGVTVNGSGLSSEEILSVLHSIQ